jgi:peptide/nickel transport system permease protein
VSVIGVIALGAPWMSPRDPMAQNLSRRLLAPSDFARLGTDGFGRDVLSRVFWGSRVSVSVGSVAVLIGALVGTSLGVVAGYFGGAADVAIMRTVDVAMSIPSLLLAIVIIAVFGRGLFNLILAIGISNVPYFARLTRGETLQIRQRDFVEAAIAVGSSVGRIMVRHILPNITASLVVLTTLRSSFAVLTESSLSFLGLGLPPPTASWGVMLAEGQRFLAIAPWVSIVPGLAIAVLVLGLNLVGDGLRDALDPRLGSERPRREDR